MKIALIKKDIVTIPYLIHNINKDKKQISLGLELYPDVEQNNYISLNKVKILKKGTKKYNYHKKIIESLLI